MAEHDTWGSSVALLAVYVSLSSLFGLVPTAVVEDPAEAMAFVGKVWSTSLVADLLFVGGMAAAGLLGALIARRQAMVFVGMGVSLGLAWLTYWASFLLIAEPMLGSTYTDGPLEVFWGVGSVGAFGLAFSTLAPALWVRAREELFSGPQAVERTDA